MQIGIRVDFSVKRSFDVVLDVFRFFPTLVSWETVVARQCEVFKRNFHARQEEAKTF